MMSRASRRRRRGPGRTGCRLPSRSARAGRSVVVLEAADTIGGGTAPSSPCRASCTTCARPSTLGAGSPYLSRLPLERHGLRWLPGTPARPPSGRWPPRLLHRSIDETADGLGEDAASYRRWIGGVAERWDELAPMVTGPLVRVPSILSCSPASASALAPTRAPGGCGSTPTRAARCSRDAPPMPSSLDHLLTSSFGLVLMAAAHAVGWPVAEGGSQCIATALAAHLTELGGEIRTGELVTSMAQRPRPRRPLRPGSPAGRRHRR